MNRFFFDNLTDKPLFWVMFLGFIASFLNLSDTKKTNKHNALNIITGVIGSMFLCYLAYEITFYFTQIDRVSIAVGGFFAWRGANWANELIDGLIRSKLNTLKDEMQE